MRGLNDAGHAGHAADQHELVDLVHRNASVLEAVLGRGDRALEQAVAQLFHLRTGQLGADVLRPGGVSRHEREIDVVLLRAGEGDLRFFRFFLDALERVRLLAQVDAVLLLEFVEHPIHQAVVPVVATQVGVAVGRLDFKDTVTDFEDRNIERTAAEIVHGDLLVLLLIETVRERGRRRFIDNAEDFQTGNATGILGGLALGVVKICGDRDHGLRDGLAEACFSVGLELREDHRGNLGRAESLGLALDFNFDGHVAIGGAHHLVRDALDLFLHFIELAAHEAFDGINRIARVGDRLTFGGIADEAFPRLGKRDHRGGRALAFGVFQHHRLTTLHDRHAGVRRA